MLISKTIRLFLDSIGRRDEYEFYLKKFQADRSVCFALVIPDTDSVVESGDLMTFDLQFLMRLDLCPLVFLGGPDTAGNLARLTPYGDYEALELTAADGDGVWREALQGCVERKKIPVVCREDAGVARGVLELVPRIARRLHVLRAAGMLHTPEGTEVFYHTTRRPNAHELRPEDGNVVNMAERWLAHEPQSHISVSSPLYLLQEMFTVRGRGSIIRPGSDIRHYPSMEGVDPERLLTLIQEAFGKPLRDPARLAEASDIYLETRYRGAVILEPHPAGKYLSKFTVGTQARGEGVAQELWDEACRNQPALFWRSRGANPVNQWYERHADGHHREEDWTVFWRGIRVERLPGVIGYALARPSDFVEAS